MSPSSSSQNAPPNKTGSSFTAPIQVSRVRPPVEVSQMHPALRTQTSDPYAHMPGTPRPVNSNTDPFCKPHLQHRPMSPQIVRQPLRLCDPYVRQPFTPRPQQTLESFSGHLPPTPTQPHVYSESYPKQPTTPRPSSRDSIGPSTPRPEVFHTPPSTPLPAASSAESYSQPRTPAPDTYPPSVGTPRPSPSPFSPPHTPHSVADNLGKPVHGHVQMSPDPYISQPHTPRSGHPSETFAQQLQTGRSNHPQETFFQNSPTVSRVQPPTQDSYCQSPQTPRSQEPFSSPVNTPRPRTKLSPLDHYSPTPTSSPHSLPSPVCEQGNSSHQQLQGVEHFGQQPPPPTSQADISSLNDPYSQSLVSGQTHSQVTASSASSGRNPQDDFTSEGPLEDDITVSEQLLKASRGSALTSGEPERSQMMARQQLRDLLKKQQMKKQLEQNFREQQGQVLPRQWPLG